MSKINTTILRPYNFFVATFTQIGSAAPELLSIDYNTFSAVPEFSTSGSGGRYFIDITNTKELDILESSSVAVNAEIIYSGSGISNKIEAFLSEDHQTINILNAYLEYAGLQDIDGQFVVYLYKYF